MNKENLLKKYAIKYLSKFDSSKKNLERILKNKIERLNNLEKKEKYLLYSNIKKIIDDLETNKFINDKNYAESKLRLYAMIGKSKNYIINYLIMKGIEKTIIEEIFENYESNNPDWEVESIKIFIRKKNINFNDETKTEKNFSKLSRAGFNYNLIKKLYK